MLRKLSYILLCLLLAFLGINAVIGGAMLVIRPGGEWLGMRKDWLLASPFESYFIPGLLLFFFLGILPLLTLYGLIKPNTFAFFDRLNVFKEKYWCWTFSLYSGLIALLWIILQQIMTPYFWIQSPVLILAWLIVVVSLLPGIQKRYSKK